MELSELLGAGLVAPRGRQRLAWLLAEPEAGPRTLAGRRRRQRRRLIRTTSAPGTVSARCQTLTRGGAASGETEGIA
jgi:hypothetical protein